MNEGVVLGFFGLCFFLCFNRRRCLNMSEYLVERKTMQVQKTENYYLFTEEDTKSLRG